MKSRVVLSLTVLAAIAALGSCGGGTVKDPAQLLSPPTDATGISRETALAQPAPLTMRRLEAEAAPVVGRPIDPPAQWQTAEPLRGVESIPQLEMLSLPPLPADAAGSVPKSVSDTYSGNLANPFDDSGNITATPTLLTLTAPESSISWAIFQFPMGAAETPNLLQYHGQITASPNGTESGLWIGLPNYNTGRWGFTGPVGVTAVSSMAIPPVASYLSPARNLYVLVLAYDGDVIELDSVAVVTTNATPPLLPDEFGFALSYLGLDETKLGMDQLIPGLSGPNEWTWTGYADLLTMMDSYWAAWYTDADAHPSYVKEQGEALATVQSIQDLLLEATAEFQTEHQITAQTHSETLDPTEPLAKAIADLVTSAGGTADQAAYNTALASLTLDDQNALAVVVEATRRALVDRNQTMTDYNTNVFGGALDQTILDGWFAAMHGTWLSNANYVPLVYDVSTEFRFLRSFPYEGFFVPAARLADALDDLSVYAATNPSFEDVSLDVATPMGNITIGGTGPDTHSSPGTEGHLILIDLGGDDTYDCNAGGTSSYTNGVSVCVDLGAGGDTYNRMDDPSTPDRTVSPSDDNTSQQGAGRLGIGMLVDYGGNDAYHSVRLSQGSAMLGVGICVDFGGSDDYDMEALGQGGAFGGVGILYDTDGDDEYRNIQMCGGFGGIMGVGFLVDQGAGLDLYRAEPDKDDTMPEYISSIDNLKNTSLCFGAAWGKTISGDTVNDPVVGSGGYGFCFDGGGNDQYIVGIYGLGLAYYQCLGICYDAGGTDTYDGWLYSQGAANHVGVGALYEVAGGDTYTNHIGSGISGSFDASICWLLERDGDDNYNGSNGCFGTGRGNANSFFIDWLGADTYTPTESDGENMTLGKAGGATSGATVGVFVDVQGDDSYDAVYADMLAGTDAAGTLPIDTPPDDATHWVRINGNAGAGHEFYPGGLGVGYDG